MSHFETPANFFPAGLPMEKIYGTETSVHMGCFAQDYMLMMAKDPEMAPKYGSTGVASSMIANRISSFFNLKGVSVSLDTACSSSLVALHQSCQTLQLRQSSLVCLKFSVIVTWRMLNKR